MIDLHKQPGENEEQFLWRIGFAKDAGELDMEWSDIAQIMKMTAAGWQTASLGEQFLQSNGWGKA